MRVIPARYKAYKKSLQEIVKLIKEYEPESLPVFVARNLNKIPAVSSDYVDVSAFLKEMAVLRKDVALIKSNKNDKGQSHIDGLKAELEEVKKMMREFGSYVERSCNSHTEQIPKSGQSKDQAPMISQTPHKSTQNEIGIEKCKRNNMSNTVPNASTERTNRRVRSRTPGSNSPSAVYAQPTPPRAPLLYRDMAIRAQPDRSSAGARERMHFRTPLHNESFIVVERKKRKKISNFTGTAQGSNKLQVAESLSAVYVSRLSKSTSAADVREYIHGMGQDCKNVELLTQKNETEFNSFKVTVARIHLDTFLKEHFWPIGIKFRTYREYTPNTRTNNNNNTKYV
ncbi:hypothetical protein ACJJTC_018418 [Scirpophaga incertulas]